MFYRYGPTGGYVNPFFALQRTNDEGRTWSKVKKIAALKHACKITGDNAMYDSMTGRIHLKLTLIPDNFQSDDAHNFACFACQYDPMTDRLYSWNGETSLGSEPRDEDFVKHCQVEGQTSSEIFYHDGVLYMLLRKNKGSMSFSRWDGNTLHIYDIPTGKMAGLRCGSIWTTDGKKIAIYGMREDVLNNPPARGADVYVWTSVNGGKNWDDGKPLVRQKDLGLCLQNLNRVMNYSGSGPFLIISEATDRIPKNFRITPTNHYDNRWRKNKKLYALDEQGRFIAGP